MKIKDKKKAPQAQASPEETAQKQLRRMRIANICCAAAFAVAAIVLLACVSAPYLRRIEALTLFLPTGLYMQECMTAPGGFLSLVSAFFTQSFASPLGGALVYAALLIGLQLLTVCALRLPWRFLPATAVAPAMCLSALLSFGYAIFSLKTRGYAFNMPIGLAIALLLLWRYRMQACAKDWTAYASPATMAIICLVGYWLAGFYGLLATALCAMVEIDMAIRRRDRLALRMAMVLIAVALVVFVPKLWGHVVGGDLMRTRVYLYGLPWLVDGETAMRIPYIIAFASLALLALAMPKQKVRGGGPSVAAIAICAAAIAAPWFMRVSDSNFMLTMRMQNSIADGDWQQAADLAAKHERPLTRLNSAMAHVAAFKLGKAGEDTFAGNIAGEPYATARELRVMHDAGAMLLSYHLGLTNYAYRWAMESMVEYGPGAEVLKTMAKCALLNGEDALAEKYLDLLSHTAHKGWAEKHRPYAGNRELMANDPELAAIMPLQRADSVFIVDNNRYEGYVWPMLARVVPDNPQQTDLALQAALICQDLNAFANNIGLYAATHDAIPKAYLEAALAWDLVTGDNVAEQLGVTAEMVERFQQFQIDTEKSGPTPTPYMTKTYGDTFWYYLMYVGNMKII